MNMRNLVKLRKVLVTKCKDRAYDNFYENKIEIWHGPDEAPFHEAICLTNDELSAFLKKLNYLQKEIQFQMKEREEHDQKSDGN